MQLKIWKGRRKKYCEKERLEVVGILEEMWQQQGFSFCRGIQKPRRIGLDDEALGLAGGTVDYSLVLHGFSSCNLMQ